MVAGHHRGGGLSQAGDALRGLRAVADGVAQAPEAIDGALRLGVAQDGLQGGQVGVHVGEDEDAHHSPIVCALGGRVQGERIVVSASPRG